MEDTGKGETEEQNQEIKPEKVVKNAEIVIFGESESSLKEYNEEWEKYIREAG